MQRATNSGCTSVKTRKSLMPRSRTSSSRRLMLLKSSTHSDTGECSKRPRAYASLSARLRRAALALGDVLDGEQDARPVVLVAGQDAALQLDVEPPAGERVVDGVADELGLAVPELRQFLDVVLQHLVAEDAVEIRHEMRQVAASKSRSVLRFTLMTRMQVGADLDARRVVEEIGAERSVTPALPPRPRRAASTPLKSSSHSDTGARSNISASSRSQLRGDRSIVVTRRMIEPCIGQPYRTREALAGRG